MFFHNDLRYIVEKRKYDYETHPCEDGQRRSITDIVIITEERIAVILLTLEKRRINESNIKIP
jgi:hypothetical protein